MTTILPSVAVLELTYRCNHACRFCSCPWFAGMLKPEAEMEVGEWKRLIEAYSAATDFFTVGPNGRLRVCNHSPVELLKWDAWEQLPECEEWMRYVRHDHLPKMCDGCDKAAKCLGGCREAARVFGGSPTAPDPIFE